MFDFRKWIRKSFRVDGRFTRNRTKRRPLQTRLTLEHLEDRLVPSTVDLTGTTTYLSQYPSAPGYPKSTGLLSPPQMLGVNSENTATGSFAGTWADGLNNNLIPVSGTVSQASTLSNGTNLSYVSLMGYAPSKELMGYQGYILSSASGMEMLGQFTDYHLTPSGTSVEDQVEVAGFNQNAPAPGGLTLGQQAMEWAIAHYGQFVADPNYHGTESQSNASCTDLVDAALMNMGAEGLDQLNLLSVLQDPYGNYVWGTQVGQFNPKTATTSDYQNIKPGDILQFHDVGAQLSTPYKFTSSNGNTYTYDYAYQQHSDIVVDNRGNGVLDTMDQNVGGQEFASIQTINLAQLTNNLSSAEITVYQPVKA